MTVVVPSENVIRKLNDVLRPCFKMINTLFEENDRLISCKEILLPRLMSGMIDIDEIKYNYPKETLA